MRTQRDITQNGRVRDSGKPQGKSVLSGFDNYESLCNQDSEMTSQLRVALVKPLSELIKACPVQLASLWLPGRGTLAAWREGSRIDTKWLAIGVVESCVRPLKSASPDGSESQVALPYAATSIGLLRVSWHAPDCESTTRLATIRQVASECAYLLKRFDASAWALRKLNRSVRLIGSCSTLWNLDRYIEKAAWSSLPALILGEFGTETSLIASYIHSCGPLQDRPFVEIRCRTLTSQECQFDVSTWFARAAGGTLFLSDLDKLPLALQRRLLAYMDSNSEQWLDPVRDTQNVRIVTSTQDSQGGCTPGGWFTRALLAELNWLAVTIPPLRERTGDIEALASWQLAKHGFNPDAKITDTLLELLRSYTWPGNLFEMEQVLVRLAVMTGEQPITLTDVRVHARCLLAETVESGVPEIQDPTSEVRVQPPDSVEAPDAFQDAVLTRESTAPRPAPDEGVDWARRIVVGDLSGIEPLHFSLRRALLFLKDHYLESVMLGELARHARISPSHLSYLFKHQLGLSFKPFLCHMRLIKAEQMLSGTDDLRITDVALDSGFNDLSHFEKMFRRFTSMSPSEYQAARGSRS